MTQAELAERMGRPKEKINYIIKGKEPISVNTAIQLERVLGIPILFWMERERIYREVLARIQQDSALEKMVDWMRSFPISELKKWGWLPKVRDPIRLSEALLSFFGLASQKEWERIYLKNTISVSFRLFLRRKMIKYYEGVDFFERVSLFECWSGDKCRNGKIK